jgi:acyl carrier protein
MTMTQDDVYGKVQEVLEDALGVDADEVKPEVSLVEDLGAESIDFLDIVFRLEKEFGIKIDQAELFPEGVLNDTQYVQDGKVTDAGMQELRNRLPHTNLDAFDADRDVEHFANVFTVEAVVKFVQSKLE